MAHENPSNVTVQVHFGAEHATFEAPITETLAAVKTIALSKLHVVQDPAIDYLLELEGDTVEDETLTLGQLLAPHPRRRVNFHVKKRPKGGKSA